MPSILFLIILPKRFLNMPRTSWYMPRVINRLLALMAPLLAAR